MPYRATYVMPARLYDGSIINYVLPDQVMITPPFAGLMLTGRRLPRVLLDGPAKNLVVAVLEALDQGAIWLYLRHADATGFTAEEYLEELHKRHDKGWLMDPTPVHEPEPAEDSQNDSD